MIHKIEHVSEGFVKVHKESLISGKMNSMVLPTRQGELEHWEESCLRVIDAFPHFDENQREFLLTGTTPDEWDDLFKRAMSSSQYKEYKENA